MPFKRMPRLISFLIVALSVMGLAGCSAAVNPTPQDVIALVNGTLIDAGGGTILPGFINAHVHAAFNEQHLKAWLDGRASRGRPEALSRFTFETCRILYCFVRRTKVKMEYILKQIGNQKYVDCLENCQIEDEQAALDIVGICGEENTVRLMLHSGNLPSAFFKLSTGLAGNVLLKFYNYSIIAAAVLTPEEVNQGKFYDFALETHRGNQFRTFYSRQEAEEWLTRE